MRCTNITGHVLACTLLLATPTMVGCGDSQSSQDVRREAGELWSAVKTWSAEKRDQAVDIFSKRREEMSETWAKAKERSKDWSADAKKELESKWVHVDAAFQRAKDASAENWDKARDAFAKAYEEFEGKLKDATAK